MDRLFLTKNIEWKALQPTIISQMNLMMDTIRHHGHKMGKTFCKLSSWLKRSTLPTDFTHMKEFCYALVSLTTNDWYIGSALDGWQRWKQHILDAKNVWTNKLSNNKKKYRLMNIHKCMHRTGIHNWIMIPITNTITGRQQLEKKLIKKLKPTLNTLWTTKKDKRRNRPAMKYRHGPRETTKKHITHYQHNKHELETQPLYTTFFYRSEYLC